MPEDVIPRKCSYCGRTFNLEYVGFEQNGKNCCGNNDCCKNRNEEMKGDKS